MANNNRYKHVQKKKKNAEWVKDKCFSPLRAFSGSLIVSSPMNFVLPKEYHY